MTVLDALQRAGASIDRIDAQYLLCHLLATGRASLIAHPERRLSAEQVAAYEALVVSRAGGTPVAYLTGTREFYGRDFVVNRHVLIPRPETELIVEQALARLSGQQWPAGRTGAGVLDMGTGSGAIAVTLALEQPQSQVTACDVSADALDTARQNAARLKATVEFIESDWYTALAGRRFDLIVANPPYVAGADAHLGQDDLRFEPPRALTDGSADGLASIRGIIAGAPQHLNPGGWLLLEHGYDQAAACRDLLLKAGLQNPICIKDLAGIDRVSGGQIG